MAESPRLDELQRKYAENPRRYFAPLANEHRKVGELSTAVAICREELARFPGHMSGHVVLGQALYESRRPTEAQAAFERALALDPENLIALRHLGDIARDRGDLREARSWYERVLEADPRNDDIAAQLSRLAPSYGRPTQAPSHMPHPTVPVAPPAQTPPRAAEPLLEPLEWTALDLGIPAPSPAERSATDAAPADAAPPTAVDGLLDLEPAELLPPAAGAESAEEPLPAERDVRESFSVISDEVSAIADDHGLVDPVDPHEPEPTETRAESASAVLWDDLLPSLEGEPQASSVDAAPAAPLDANADAAQPVADQPLDRAEQRREIGTPPGPEVLAEAWAVTVDVAHDVELTRLERAGPVEERGDDGPAAADVGPTGSVAEPTADPVAIDDAIDVYDFLLPVEEPTTGRAAEGREPQSPGALPSFTAPLAHVSGDDAVRAVVPAATFARSPIDEYDPVVGLDVPPAPPVPPVLAEAVPALDGEDGGSPTPAGVFVTETMAQLLSTQGHLEQALEVYAQLQASRPADEALRARADALRARMAPPAPTAGAPTAGAFFASLALDDPADAGPAGAVEEETAPSVSSHDLAATAPPEVAAEEPSVVASERSNGFFDALPERTDERAATRLAQAFGAHVDAPSSLVAAIFDAPAAPAPAASAPDASSMTSPAMLPDTPAHAPEASASAAAEVPYGLGEFSFERFFVGLEEDAQAEAPAHDAWPELPAATPQAAASHPSDDRTSPADVARPAPAASDDEDLAQFNAWLKGLIDP